MPLEELRQLLATLSEPRGGDFSVIRGDCDPVPWSYRQVASRYLSPLHRVLDIGTGDGEQFLALAEYFGSGVGIDADPQMVALAEQNTPSAIACRVKFLPMDAAALEFPAASFDVVLARHAPVYPAEVIRVLRPGGVFVTQQFGARHHANITALFGCGPDGRYTRDPGQTVAAWAEAFAAHGCVIRARGEYDVPYFYRDAASLLLWLRALPVPEDFDIERHWPQIDHILREFQTPRGIATNVHRELLIVQKPG